MPASGPQPLKERLERATAGAARAATAAPAWPAIGRGGAVNRLELLSEDPTADRSWLEISNEVSVRKWALGALLWIKYLGHCVEPCMSPWLYANPMCRQ